MNNAERQRKLESWLENHQGLIFKIIRAYAFAPHDREDLLQEISIQLWDSIPRFKGKSAETTWIYRVALYASIAWSKRERRHSDRSSEVEPMPLVDEPVEDPRLGWLYAQLATLEEIDRSLMLMLLDGMSYAEMANALGISEQNVGVKIHRIKKVLVERSNRDGDRHEL